MKITVKEFRMWLQGVEEMQDENWTPDTRQWNKIREKINEIIDNDSEAFSSAHYNIRTLDHLPNNTSASLQLQERPASVARHEGPVQMAASGLGNVAPIQPSNVLSQGSGGMVFGNADTPAIPTKTPNIDTSSAPYEPMFV